MLHTLTMLIHVTQIGLCNINSLLCGFAEPLERLSLVLPHTTTMMLQDTQIVLCIMSLLCGFVYHLKA